jgi:multidrug efflux pump subunit AcrB
VLRRPGVSILMVLLLIISAAGLWRNLEISRFPKVSQEETILEIDWNEPVTLDENNLRINYLLSSLITKPEYVIEEAGKQQYLLNSGEDAGTSENKLFIKTSSPDELSKITTEISNLLLNEFPAADYHFSESNNLFNLAFGKSEAPLIARFSHFNPGNENYIDELTALLNDLESEYKNGIQSKLIKRKLILLETNP